MRFPASSRLLSASLMAAAVASAGHATSIAVLRGQTSVDPRILPLVCLEVATLHAALPLDYIVVQKLPEQKTIRLNLANTFSTAKSDLLTAYSGASDASLSLPIFRLQVGRYRILKIGFDRGAGSPVGFDVPIGEIMDLEFQVAPACVNYVGSLQITADWETIRRGLGGPIENNGAKKVSFQYYVIASDDTRRDVKWACDTIPAMKGLPLAISLIVKRS